MEDLKLTLDAFVRAIGVNRSAPHSVFLGGGASISSGIPSADLCIWEWKRNIFLTNNPGVERQFSELTLKSVRDRIQKWLDSKGCYPKNGSSEEYSFYIEHCFPINQHRQQFFADKIRSVHPYIGYKLLCMMAEAEIIKSVWTTNFDGLVAKAAAGFKITPVEVGIDCQDRTIRPVRRGELLCVSLHGDYRYDKLKNTEIELQQQEKQLQETLIEQLQTTALIVIGYSGRDASVMQALKKAYICPGTAPLYWCGYGEEITDDVKDLLESVRATGRTSYFVPTLGFDDTFKRLALHCLAGDQHEQVTNLLSELSKDLRLRNDPFVIDKLSCAALIKSNAFEIDCPSEVFAIDIKKWPDNQWEWLDALTKGKRFVAVPQKNKVLALGLLDEIKRSFDGNISGAIQRTPLTDTDTNLEHGQTIALMVRALLQAFAEKSNVATDGRRLLWERNYYDKKIYEGRQCRVHRAAAIYLRKLFGHLHLVIRPTVAIFNNDGNALPESIEQILKIEILGYQHNDKFNQALDHWRNLLFDAKGTITLEYPANSGSAFKFKLRCAPGFAQIGARVVSNPVRISNNILPVISQVGIQIPEPSLLFSSGNSSQYLKDTHPLRGLRVHKPFDYSLTTQGVAPSIRLGVVCPNSEAQIVSQYLYQSGQTKTPNKTEMDYLIEYPGFQQSFGLPLEIPRPGDSVWAICPEPRNQGDAKKSSLELATFITRSIESIVAAEKPHVVIVFIPNRWSAFREYQDENESFDLHDFVKAYCAQKGIATQFLEQDTLNSNQQCRVWWWLSVGLYAKSMRTPWVLDSLDKNAAFVGLGFTTDYHSQKGQHVVMGCSHLYNAQGEGLQFRLSKIENPIFRHRRPHMSYEDARHLAENIRQLFFESQLRLPPRVVIHKQTPFLIDEKNGLLDGLSGVGVVDLIEITEDRALRYVSSLIKSDGKFGGDNFPVRRGTVVQLSQREALVWCHGVTDAVKQGWRYFQGKRHIPAPLHLKRHAGTSDLETLTAEILGLSKMDWNSGDMYSKMPTTIYSSKQIARIGAKLQRFGPVSYDYRLFM